MPDDGGLEIQVPDGDTASVTLVQGDRTWTANYLGDASRVITVGNGATQLRGVELGGASGTVDLTASVDC